ncbi:ribonucleoside-diphosphate reductase subunit alpha [Candidatus Nomurabacteria bacterium]|nr:ribonucleoside-diphosphate reductase subunit alpha [Candidatus Nomurabacteria bacterium]MCB9820543.1 ribonucleoside-diphosphate reductase subunit alpha [Candidatus Nomurabacteria bacterium]
MVNNITITRRDGTKEIFDADRINRSIERACRGLSDPIGMVTQIATETHLTLYDGITEDELDEATINAALQNAQLDPDFDTAATRILIKTMYKRVLGDYKNDEDLKRVHVERFPAHILELIDAGLVDKRLGTLFNLKELAEALDPRRDDLYKYSGASTMANRYMVKNEKQQAIEIPQYFWMRVAMGLSLSESEPTKWAKKFYDKMSKLEYLSAGSTNLGAGTPVPKLSNCFLMEMHDNMEHIGKTVSDVLLLSKATGGIGLSVTKLRANGSILKSSNTVSSGPIPFMHIIDSSIRAVQRGGKKKGALCFYMENWHLDFQDFLDLKQNAGDDYRRTRTANTAVYLSDEFMRRVVKGEDWYLFDPNEVKDLPELYGQEFAKRYCEYVEMAKAGKLKLWDKLPARQQYKNILVSLETTSHPWLTWKDTINVRALNNNTGTIHSSNLCTEVTLPQDKDNIAVCNLISINLSRHIINGQVDWHKLEESARLATRQLDNLIDINVLPVPEARKADDENRAVGLGLMGFAESIERMGFSYEDEEAFDFTDKIFEFISYMAIDESANLAKERGVYKNFEGSGWSKGLVPVDTMSILEAERGVVIDTKKGSVGQTPMLDWDTLRSKVKKGVRNATLMAIAPNANIGLVAGTSPGIDPRFAQIFSRNKISGKYLEVNTNMVADLKKLGLWDKYRDEIIKHYGDLEPIAQIPEDVKKLYKTSFAIDPFAFIEVAARAQKWVDQAISRNMYLETRDIDKVMNIYQGAWERGLKTTYYLHMKPRHSAEQSTIKVNKSEAIGKKGFAALSFAAKPKEEVVQESQAIMEELPTKVEPDTVKKPEFVVHGPVDPQDANICEGCE